MGNRGIIITLAVVWILLISLLVWYYFFKDKTTKITAEVVEISNGEVVDENGMMENDEMIEQLA